MRKAAIPALLLLAVVAAAPAGAVEFEDFYRQALSAVRSLVRPQPADREVIAPPHDVDRKMALVPPTAGPRMPVIPPPPRRDR